MRMRENLNLVCSLSAPQMFHTVSDKRHGKAGYKNLTLWNGRRMLPQATHSASLILDLASFPAFPPGTSCE